MVLFDPDKRDGTMDSGQYNTQTQTKGYLQNFYHYPDIGTTKLSPQVSVADEKYREKNSVLGSATNISVY